MYLNWLRRNLTVLLILAAVLATTVAPALAQQKKLKELSDKDDPALIGKRDINKGQMNFYSLDKEVALGRQMSAEIDAQSPLITDPLVLEFVNRVAQNIVLHSDAKVPFTVKVVDEEVVNAFALPGGFLYVNRGLLEAAENEAEVAGVMAHEIAHVTARHGVEQQSKAQFFNYASIPLIFLGGVGGYAIQSVVGLVVPLGFLKFSRGAEKEADRLGAQYMWASGYDPNALITFFEKLQSNEKRKPGTLEKIFSTHPMTGDRITEVQKLIARFPEKNEYALSSSDFEQVRTRLGAVASARRPLGKDNGPVDDKRPRLKRRPEGSTTDNGDDEIAEDKSSSKNDADRPTLRRGGESSGSTTTTSSSSSSPGSSSGSSSSSAGTDERPELKRREDNSVQPVKETAVKEKAAQEGDRPVLKRREGSESETAAKPAEKTVPAESTEKPVLKRKAEEAPKTDKP